MFKFRDIKISSIQKLHLMRLQCMQLVVVSIARSIFKLLNLQGLVFQD